MHALARFRRVPCEFSDPALEVFQPGQSLGADDELLLLVFVLVRLGVGDVASVAPNLAGVAPDLPEEHLPWSGTSSPRTA